MAAQRPRPLFLHTSALSDAEYMVYFDALHDILDEPEPGGGTVNPNPFNEDLEAHVIGMREARAWMRGRFKTMGLSNVDKILSMLAPYVQNQCISAGQFFAALRLLMHARNGSDVNEAMLFVQADLSSKTAVQPPNSSNTSSSAVELQASAPTETVANAPVPLTLIPNLSPLAVASVTSSIPSSSSAASTVHSSSSAPNATSIFDLKHTFFSSVPALSAIETSVASSSSSTTTTIPILPTTANTGGPPPVLASSNPRVNEIKMKILDLRRRALTFASYGEMLERDPLLVKEIMRSFADLKREQELASDVQRHAPSEDTVGSISVGPVHKKHKGNEYGRLGHDYSNQTKRNAQNTYARHTICARLREITKDPEVEMRYLNYETNIVHRYGVELIGWPLDKFSLDGISGHNVQAVADGLMNGSIRWVKLTEEQLIARIEAWKTRDVTKDVVRKKRIRNRNRKKVQSATAEEPRSEEVQTNLEEDSTVDGADAEEVEEVSGT